MVDAVVLGHEGCYHIGLIAVGDGDDHVGSFYIRVHEEGLAGGGTADGEYIESVLGLLQTLLIYVDEYYIVLLIAH